MWCFYSGFSGSWDSPLSASRFCERDLCVFGCNRGRKSELGLVGSGSGNMNSSFLQIQGYPSNGAITTDRSKQNSSSQLLLLTSGPSSLSSAPLKDILISFEMWILLIVCHELPEENGGSDILVKEQKVIWVVGDWEKGNVRGKLGLLKANFIFLLISPVAGIAWATSSSFFFFFQKSNSHESWGYSWQMPGTVTDVASSPHVSTDTIWLAHWNRSSRSFLVQCSMQSLSIKADIWDEARSLCLFQTLLWILYRDLSSRHPIILLWLPQHLEIQRTIWCWFTEYPLDQWCSVYAKLDWLTGICLSPPPTKLVL